MVLSDERMVAKLGVFLDIDRSLLLLLLFNPVACLCSCSADFVKKVPSLMLLWRMVCEYSLAEYRFYLQPRIYLLA